MYASCFSPRREVEREIEPGEPEDRARLNVLSFIAHAAAFYGELQATRTPTMKSLYERGPRVGTERGGWLLELRRG